MSLFPLLPFFRRWTGTVALLRPAGKDDARSCKAPAALGTEGAPPRGVDPRHPGQAAEVMGGHSVPMCHPESRNDFGSDPTPELRTSCHLRTSPVFDFRCYVLVCLCHSLSVTLSDWICVSRIPPGLDCSTFLYSIVMSNLSRGPRSPPPHRCTVTSLMMSWADSYY